MIVAAIAGARSEQIGAVTLLQEAHRGSRGSPLVLRGSQSSRAFCAVGFSNTLDRDYCIEPFYPAGRCTYIHTA